MKVSRELRRAQDAQAAAQGGGSQQGEGQRKDKEGDKSEDEGCLGSCTVTACCRAERQCKHCGAQTQSHLSKLQVRACLEQLSLEAQDPSQP